MTITIINKGTKREQQQNGPCPYLIDVPPEPRRSPLHRPVAPAILGAWLHVPSRFRRGCYPAVSAEDGGPVSLAGPDGTIWIPRYAVNRPGGVGHVESRVGGRRRR